MSMIKQSLGRRTCSHCPRKIEKGTSFLNAGAYQKTNNVCQHCLEEYLKEIKKNNKKLQKAKTWKKH